MRIHQEVTLPETYHHTPVSAPVSFKMIGIDRQRQDFPKMGTIFSILNKILSFLRSNDNEVNWKNRLSNFQKTGVSFLVAQNGIETKDLTCYNTQLNEVDVYFVFLLLLDYLWHTRFLGFPLTPGSWASFPYNYRWVGRKGRDLLDSNKWCIGQKVHYCTLKLEFVD